MQELLRPCLGLSPPLLALSPPFRCGSTKEMACRQSRRGGSSLQAPGASPLPSSNLLLRLFASLISTLPRCVKRRGEVDDIFLIRQVGIANVRTTEFLQGRTSRWAVAWWVLRQFGLPLHRAALRCCLLSVLSSFSRFHPPCRPRFVLCLSLRFRGAGCSPFSARRLQQLHLSNPRTCRCVYYSA